MLTQMTPDGLTELARRLREHADGIRNPAARAGMGADMRAAAQAIEDIVKLHAGAPKIDGSHFAIILDLPPDEAMALAQFCKRLTADDRARFADTSVTYSGVSEADTIWSGIVTLRRGLADAGFAPR